MQKFHVTFEEKSGSQGEREVSIAVDDSQLEGYGDGGAGLVRTLAAQKLFGTSACWQAASAEAPYTGHVYRADKDGTLTRVSGFASMEVTALGK